MSIFRDREAVVTVELGPLQKLRESLQPKAHAILDKASFDMLASAQANAPVDTGAMRASGYVSGTDGGQSNYSEALAEASSRRETEFNAEEKPGTPFERVIGFSVIYALIQEIVHQAYLRPAVERHRTAFMNAWKGLFK
jgi:hypothetical protein